MINLTIFVGNIWSLVWLHWPYWPLCVLWLLWLYWMYWFDWLYWLDWLYSEQCTVGHTMVTNTMGLVFLACKKCAFLAWKKCVGHNMVTYNGSWVCIATPISTSLMEILPDKISRGEGGSFGDTTCYWPAADLIFVTDIRCLLAAETNSDKSFAHIILSVNVVWGQERAGSQLWFDLHHASVPYHMAHMSPLDDWSDFV